MDSGSRKSQVDQKVDIKHGIQMGVEQGTLGHPMDDLPERGVLHAVPGQMEHDTRVEDLIRLIGRGISVWMFGPNLLEFAGTDFGDDSTRSRSNGGEGLTEGEV